MKNLCLKSMVMMAAFTLSSYGTTSRFSFMAGSMKTSREVFIQEVKKNMELKEAAVIECNQWKETAEEAQKKLELVKASNQELTCQLTVKNTELNVKTKDIEKVTGNLESVQEELAKEKEEKESLMTSFKEKIDKQDEEISQLKMEVKASKTQEDMLDAMGKLLERQGDIIKIKAENEQLKEENKDLKALFQVYEGINVEEEDMINILKTSNTAVSAKTDSNGEGKRDGDFLGAELNAIKLIQPFPLDQEELLGSNYSNEEQENEGQENEGQENE